MSAFVQSDWLAAGINSFQTRLNWDATLMSMPLKRKICLCGKEIEKSAYIFNPLTNEMRHIGICCYPRFVNNIMKKSCSRCHQPHQCKTELCRICRGPKIHFGIHEDNYISDIADVDPEYFDWLFRECTDDDLRSWFEQNMELLIDVRHRIYHDGTKFKFGQYINKTIGWVLHYDPDYLMWIRAKTPRKGYIIPIHCWMDLNWKRLVSVL